MDEKTTTGGQPRPARVLVADDHAAIRSLAAFHLRDENWDVVFVDDASKALDACGAGEFDLLLLDLNMPGGGGKAVVDGLGEHCPKALALSASCTDEEFVLPAGFVGMVPKPFTRESLLAAIRVHLNESGVASAGAGGVDGAAGDVRSGGGENSFGGSTDPALAPLLPRVMRVLRQDADVAQAALADGDLPLLRERAHAMRGAAACYGLGILTGAAEALEHAAQQGDTASSAKAIGRLRTLLASDATT